MSRWLWRFGLLSVCLLGVGCKQKWSHKKPDPTKGVVTGVVVCADTSKPARFASVILTRVPKKDEKTNDSVGVPEPEETVTDLDGRFRLEAVEPGQYYAYATLEGYLDPKQGIDIKQAMAMPDEKSKELEAIRQWKDHLVEVTVAAHRVSEVPLAIERGAEIRGTISFDDGSPAIGMHFLLARRKAAGKLPDSGVSLSDQWLSETVSDGHGHFSLTNLPLGEYIVCALMPTESEEDSPRICLGDTFRIKKAKPIKVTAGEILDGVDLVIPLSGMHTVAGQVTVLADGHVPSGATVRLLYPDDREELRKETIDVDGSFAFGDVPENNYLVQVTEAKDAPPAAGGNVHLYADMEIPVLVKDDVDDLHIELLDAAPAAPKTP